MATIDELRERKAAHSKRLDAVLWVKVADLVARWAVDGETILAIPRGDLPYLELGASNSRRYDPRDVEAFEDKRKRTGTAA